MASFIIHENLTLVLRDYPSDRELKEKVTQKEKNHGWGTTRSDVGSGNVIRYVVHIGILKLDMPEDCFLDAYADDVAVVIVSVDKEMAQILLI